MTKDEATTIRPARHLRRACRVAAFIVAVAPPVGFWIYFALMSLRFADVSGVSLDALRAVPEALAVGSVLSYLIGGVPALLAAGAGGWWVWRHGTLGYGQAAAFAVGACVVVVACLQLSAYPDVTWGSTAGLAAFLGSISAMSAVVCRWAMGRLGLLPAGSPRAAKS